MEPIKFIKYFVNTIKFNWLNNKIVPKIIILAFNNLKIFENLKVLLKLYIYIYILLIEKFF